jgi:hypothetical protein
VLTFFHSFGELDLTLAREERDASDLAQVDANGIAALRLVVIFCLALLTGCRLGSGRLVAHLRLDGRDGTGRIERLDLER